jgi:hypothetical protein
LVAEHQSAQLTRKFFDIGNTWRLAVFSEEPTCEFLHAELWCVLQGSLETRGIGNPRKGLAYFPDSDNNTKGVSAPLGGSPEGSPKRSKPCKEPELERGIENMF